MLALVATGTTVAGAAHAQIVPRQFQIGPRAGTISYDDASGIKRSGLLGVDAAYFVTRNIGIGALLELSRPETNGDFFPAELSFGDTTFVYKVSQPLTILNAQVTGVIALPMGRLAPFVNGGVGVYRMYLDPQVAGGPESFSDMSLSIGGGINIRVGQASGLRFEIRDQVFTNFDRDRLNPVGPRFQPRRYPELIPPPVAAKSTIHNIALVAAFSFVPATTF
jgi:hypothetical protein